MIFYLKKILIFVTALLIISACTGQIKKPAAIIDYYTLEYPSPQITGLTPLPVVLGVRRFQVAPAYNTNKIIYREKNFKSNSYHYHKWRANPGDLVSYFLARDFQQASIFKAAFKLDKKIPTSHVIAGTVDEFLEHQLNQSWEAVLTVSITLMRAREPDISKRIIFQKQYSSRKPFEQKNPRSLAEAMSHAMAEISAMILKDVYQSLAAAHYNADT
jgi:cholesterol transport system auxiliary component